MNFFNNIKKCMEMINTMFRRGVSLAVEKEITEGYRVL